MGKHKNHIGTIVLACAVIVLMVSINILKSIVGSGLPLAFAITALIAVLALALRVFIIPKFTIIPGKPQAALEAFVSFFDRIGSAFRSFGRKIRSLPFGAGMDKKTRNVSLIVFGCAALVFVLAATVIRSPGGHEPVDVLMRDAVLHEVNRISLFGITDVNPSLISAFTVTAFLFVFSLIVRIFVIPKFTYVPGKFQLLLETVVSLFDGLAKGNSPHRNKFLGGYIFTAGVYIFVGTIFELFGFQVITTNGASISLPAPFADINGALMIGCLSYLVILSGGIAGNKLRGIGRTLKEFSLPISMSFRIFGALLSGALVTELVYHYQALSYGLPVLVGVMFTLLHALIQAYVLTMLTALFYGEVSEPTHKKA